MLNPKEQRKLTIERIRIADEILNERVTVPRLSDKFPPIMGGKWRYRDSLKTILTVRLYPHYYEAIEEFTFIAVFKLDSSRVIESWCNLPHTDDEYKALSIDLKCETSREKAIRECILNP